MRKAFTLVELLVIVAIMGAMVTVSVVNVRAGQGVARIRGAARDIFAVVRHARSLALLSQKPAIITYSCTEEEDGEPVAKVEVTGVKVLNTAQENEDVQTLSGEPIELEREDEGEKEDERIKLVKLGDDDEMVNSNEVEGITVEDVLFAPISTDVVRGMRLKVLKEGEVLENDPDSARQKSKISVFSNVNYLLGKYQEANEKKNKTEETTESKKTSSSKDDKTIAPVETQEPVSIVWETNGRVEPHKVWIYPDGAKPEDGLCIRVDRFGSAKVLSPGEKDDDD